MKKDRTKEYTDKGFVLKVELDPVMDEGENVIDNNATIYYSHVFLPDVFGVIDLKSVKGKPIGEIMDFVFGCLDALGVDSSRQHELKCWPEFFEEVFMDRKTFELRKNDRDFKVADFVHLKEYDPKTDSYTGRQLARRIKYILHGPAFGLAEGYCIMSIA